MRKLLFILALTAIIFSGCKKEKSQNLNIAVFVPGIIADSPTYAKLADGVTKAVEEYNQKAAEEKKAKLSIMRQYPDMGAFAVRAFYEKDPEVSADIQKSMAQYLNAHAAKKLAKLDPEDFIPGIDLQMMYKEMYWASEGCLWEYIQRGYMNVDAMEKDFRKLLEFWKKVYLRKSREETCDDGEDI